MESRIENLSHARARRDKERLIKDSAKREGLRLGGGVSREFTAIFNKAEGILEGLKERHTNWIDKRKQEFGGFFDGVVSQEEVEDIFRDGLRVSLLQKYKLFQKVIPEEIGTLSEEEIIVDHIGAYSLEFVNTLRIAKEDGLPPKTALELAKLSYRHNPNTIGDLQVQYPDLPKWVILAAAISTPAQTQERLTAIVQAIPDLQKKFPQMGKWVIIRAVTVHPKNPEGFLEHVQTTMPLLIDIFPDFEEGVVRDVVVNRKNAKPYLLDLRRRVGELEEKFPDLSRWVIVRVAVKNPENTKLFLENIQIQAPLLQKQFPKMSYATIVQALISHPSDPEGKLKSVRDLIPQLEQEFPDFGEGVIASAAMDHSDARVFLTNARSERTRLAELFPDILLGDIITAVTEHSNAKEYLRKVQGIISKLKQGFPHLKPSVIAYAAIHYPNASEEFLKKFESVKQELIPLYTDLPKWAITQAALQYSKNPTKKLDDVREKLPILKQKYPGVPEKTIIWCLMQRPRNPEAAIATKYKEDDL